MFELRTFCKNIFRNTNFRNKPYFTYMIIKKLSIKSTDSKSTKNIQYVIFSHTAKEMYFISH